MTARHGSGRVVGVNGQIDRAALGSHFKREEERKAKRSVRDYDVPTPDAESIMSRHGIEHDTTGEVPEWFRRRFGSHMEVDDAGV